MNENDHKEIHKIVDKINGSLYLKRIYKLVLVRVC
jgi:hypothetical protein